MHNNVRRMRLKAGMTQAGMGADAGVARQTIIAIENGTSVSSLSTAMRIARALGSRIEDVFHDDQVLP
jgi:DNA-binding XRE family transcriptional regulator